MRSAKTSRRSSSGARTPGSSDALPGVRFPTRLLRRAELVSVHVVTGETATPEPPKARTLRERLRALLGPGLPIGLLAAVGLGRGRGRHRRVADALGSAAQRFDDLPDRGARLRGWFGVRSAIVAAVLSFLAYDFFFIPPLYEFTIAEPQEFFALVIFLIVAVSRRLARRPRARSGAARLRERAHDAVAVRALAQAFRRRRARRILEAATVYAQKTLGARCVAMLLPDDAELNLASAWPPLDALGPGETGAARWAFEKREAAGWKTGTLPNVRFQFRPLVTTRGVVGVCGFEPADPEAAISPTMDHALTLILEQAAIAIDRAMLVKDSLRTAALEDNEKLRSTLLASLSHDLRTPLASITGAATTLQKFGDTLSAEKRRDLLDSIEEETQRLARFVANLLDMSRIDAGALRPKSEYVEVAEVVRSAVERARKAFPGASFSTSLARDLPFARGDAGLIEQVLFNVLDNAQKYGGDAPIAVHARRAGEEVLISVTDEGPGVKTADLPRIFEKFYQGGKPDGRKTGVGLGLSIAKGLVEAMGGRDLGGKPGGAAARHAARRRAARRRGAGARQVLAERGDMSGARILIVDDEPQILRFLRPALEASGYDVLHAETGREALRIAANAAPDLIILDLGLPDMDGKEVLTAGAAIHQGANRHSLRARPRGGEDRRARSRRRRLRRKALRDRRTARAPARGASPRARRRGAADPRRGGRPRHRHGPQIGDARRRRGEADAARIRPSLRARAQRRARDDARPDPDRGLGPRAQGRHAISESVRRAAARENRARPVRARHHPHRIRDRLPLQGRRVTDPVRAYAGAETPTPIGHDTPVPPRPQ